MQWTFGSTPQGLPVWRATAPDGGCWAILERPRLGYLLTLDGRPVANGRDNRRAFYRWSEAAGAAELANEMCR